MHGFAADDDGGFHLERRHEGDEGIVHLEGEFARGHEDEAAALVLGGEALDHGDAERQCLAGAGLGDADDIFALDRGGNRLVLDGGGDGVFEAINYTEKAWCNAEAVETFLRGCHACSSWNQGILHEKPSKVHGKGQKSGKGAMRQEREGGGG